MSVDVDGLGPGVLPQCLPAAAVAPARAALARDGAVILRDLPVAPESLVFAAAAMFGTELRQLFPLRSRRSRDDGQVDLHADSLDIVVETAGGPIRRRDPNEDHVLVQCVDAPPSGGESFVLDAYRLIDRLATQDPEMWSFLAGVDVDLYARWAGVRGLPAASRVARHVEFTRTGRRIVRRTDGAGPLHRDPDAGHVSRMLSRLDVVVGSVQTALPRFALARGDVLVVDNYRCWHGRDGHEGERTVRILTVRTAHA